MKCANKKNTVTCTSFYMKRKQVIARQQRNIKSNASLKEFFNPFPNKPWFLRVCMTGLLKTLREEQFILFPVFSTLLKNFLPYSSNLKLSSANTFSLERTKICRLGKGQAIRIL